MHTTFSLDPPESEYLALSAIVRSMARWSFWTMSALRSSGGSDRGFAQFERAKCMTFSWRRVHAESILEFA